MPNKNLEALKEARLLAQDAIKIGIFTSIGLFGTFLLWSLTAKIDSSAIAAGKVVLNSNKRIIQHLEGGMIEEIFVKDGDKVVKDQPLVRLSEVAAKANQEVFSKQLLALKATKIRLECETDYKTNPDFSKLRKQYQNSLVQNNSTKNYQEIVTENNFELEKIIANEQDFFFSRKKAIDEKVAILSQKIRQLNQEIKALKSQQKSINERIVFVAEEAKSLDELYEAGIISRSRYLELKKQMSELLGSKGEYAANISKVRQVINETELEIANTKTEKINEVMKELQETQVKIADLEERSSASSDVLERTIIKAPQDGVVHGLKFHTTGGVVAPGGEIMEIVPQDDELIIEVKINPQDIDVVHEGLKAKVHLSAYKSKTVPLLSGIVMGVSADSFIEQATNVAYFIARVKIDKEEMQKLNGVQLYPGMPAEAYIVTGSRTFMKYLFDPISTSLNKVFREE